MPEVSVIIPFRGKVEDLKKCLHGLRKQDSLVPFELIVVESGSNPEVKHLVNSFPNSTLISCKSVMYPGRGRNLGAENSKSDFLAFIDADCFPLSNWIDEIYKSLESGFKAVIGPVINLYPFHPLASADNLLQFPDFQKHRPSKNISHFPACNLGIKKEVFLNAGKFPEEFLTGEDVKFSESVIKNIKEDILFNKKLIVRHCGRKKIKSFVKHNWTLGFHRGYLNLKITKVNNKNRGSLFHALSFGTKRLIYISARTLLWNPIGIIRIIFFFPLIIIGLSAWSFGFWKGNKKYLEENFEV